MKVHILKCTHMQGIEFFDHVKPWLDKAVRRVAPPWVQTDDLRIKLLNGDYVMWLMFIDGKPCAVALSELVSYYDTLLCGVQWLGGARMNSWLPFALLTIEQWGRDAGAKYLYGFGRDGWIRAAGMKKYGNLFVKEIKNGT